MNFHCNQLKQCDLIALFRELSDHTSYNRAGLAITVDISAWFIIAYITMNDITSMCDAHKMLITAFHVLRYEVVFLMYEK